MADTSEKFVNETMALARFAVAVVTRELETSDRFRVAQIMAAAAAVAATDPCWPDREAVSECNSRMIGLHIAAVAMQSAYLAEEALKHCVGTA